MDRDPGDFQDFTATAPGGGRTGDERARWLAKLPPAPGILYVDDDDPEEDAQVEADIAAGRVYPHAIVGEWLKTAGKPDWAPFEEWLAARDG